MTNDIYKRSRLTRYSWLGLAIFFIIFCSCPIKRFFKLQLYKHSDPIESSSNNAAFAKELKDCNLINKHGLVQVVRFANITRPKPEPTIKDVPPFVFFVSTLVSDDIFDIFKNKRNKTRDLSASYPIDGALPIYLALHRLQV